MSTLKKIAVYDPPMCCPTGVCSPSVDPVLPRFAVDLDWLTKKGVVVERFNLAQQPAAFAENALIRDTLAAQGNDCLPLVLVDGEVATQGRYPSRQELADLAGVSFDKDADQGTAEETQKILPMAGGCACSS